LTDKKQRKKERKKERKKDRKKERGTGSLIIERLMDIKYTDRWRGRKIERQIEWELHR
jgi:hypothetical protein